MTIPHCIYKHMMLCLGWNISETVRERERERERELRRPIAIKLYRMIDIWVRFIMSPKNWWAKTMQNLGRFFQLSTLIANIRKASRYPKSERHVMENDNSRVHRNNSGELWSTIQKVQHVSLNQPKSTFRGIIFRPLGGAAPPILQALKPSTIQSELRRRAASSWILPSSFLCFIL